MTFHRQQLSLPTSTVQKVHRVDTAIHRRENNGMSKNKWRSMLTFGNFPSKSSLRPHTTPISHVTYITIKSLCQSFGSSRSAVPRNIPGPHELCFPPARLFFHCSLISCIVQVGDVIVLTKPLGTSITTDALALSKSKDPAKVGLL